MLVRGVGGEIRWKFHRIRAGIIAYLRDCW